jgi:hypothetical protein
LWSAFNEVEILNYCPSFNFLKIVYTITYQKIFHQLYPFGYNSLKSLFIPEKV